MVIKDGQHLAIWWVMGAFGFKHKYQRLYFDVTDCIHQLNLIAYTTLQ